MMTYLYLIFPPHVPDLAFPKPLAVWSILLQNVCLALNFRAQTKTNQRDLQKCMGRNVESSGGDYDGQLGGGGFRLEGVLSLPREREIYFSFSHRAERGGNLSFAFMVYVLRLEVYN